MLDIRARNVYYIGEHKMYSKSRRELNQLLEEKLAGIVLSKLRNVMNYDPSQTSDSSQIIIPVDDAYNAFIANEIIDESHFGADNAKTVEKQVYQKFTERKSSAITEIINEMNNSGAKAYKDLSDEMKAYMDSAYIQARTF